MSAPPAPRPADPAQAAPLSNGLMVAVLGVCVLSGLLVGLLWPQLVDPVVVERNEVGVATDELALSQRFDNDGWFTVLGASTGVLLGLALTVVLFSLRRVDAVATVLLVTAGSLLAGLVASLVGTWAGPSDPGELLAASPSLSQASEQVTVRAQAAYLAWPGAALVGALLVLWSPPERKLFRLRGRATRAPLG